MSTPRLQIELVFDDLFKKFSSQRFLRGEGTAGEIQFYAQTYDPKDQVLVDKQIPHLKKRLSAAGIETLEINLFQLCIELLKEEDILQTTLEAERGQSKNEFLEALLSQLKGETAVIASIEKEGPAGIISRCIPDWDRGNLSYHQNAYDFEQAANVSEKHPSGHLLPWHVR